MIENRLKVFEIIPTLGGGGAEKMVLDLADGMKSVGCDVTVISLYGPEHAVFNRLDFAREKKIKIIYLNKKKGFDLSVLFNLGKLIIKEKPNIVHTHIESFQYVALLRQFINFNHIHTMHSIIGNESKIYQKLIRLSSKTKTTYFVVLSDAIGDDMIRSFSTTNERLICIPNGIDREYFVFKNRELRPSVTFINVGSLIPVKNQLFLIEAFSVFNEKRKKEDKLYILGDGYLRADLENTIHSLGLEKQIKLTGNVSNVRDYLYDSDIFILTSQYEGVSLALLEAASTGLPIIATATGNTPQVVNNEAILIQPDDLERLVSAMIEISEDHELRKEYISLSQNISSRFDKERMIERYLNLYHMVAENN